VPLSSLARRVASHSKVSQREQGKRTAHRGYGKGVAEDEV